MAEFDELMISSANRQVAQMKETLKNEPDKVQYQVRLSSIYTVTRYSETATAAGSEPKGQFSNPQVAYEVAYALCREEHSRLGWDDMDERITYPQYPDAVDAAPPKV